MISLTKLKIRRLVEQNIKGAKTLEKLRKKPHRLLINIAIANNIVIIPTIIIFLILSPSTCNRVLIY